MASKKPRLTQAQKRASGTLSKLKRLGLFKGETRRPTRYGVKIARQLDYVAKGRAAVVTVPRGVAADYKQQYRVRYGKVIVPKAAGERVRFSKAQREITSTRKFQGKDITARKPRAINSPYDLPRGPNIRYVVPLGGGTVKIRYDSFDQLVKDMSEYEAGRRNKYGARYEKWWRYVEIETIS